MRVALPPDARGSRFSWSADGRRFAFLNRGPDAMELWVGDAESGAIRRIPDVRINPVLSSELAWMPDQRTLLVKQVPPARGPAAQRPTARSGPLVKESQGRSASSTYEARDLLTGPDDEPFFEYYTLSQIALVGPVSGGITPVGEPEIFAAVQPSPDGRLLLVERLHGPWSYTHAWYRFPREVQVLDLTLDVCPAYQDKLGYRITFFGDEVERIIEFDVVTGELRRQLSAAAIYPARHFITDQDKLKAAIADIETELTERVAYFKTNDQLLEAQRIEGRTIYDLEMLREVGYCSGIENYSRHLDQRAPGTSPWTLMDYLPSEYLLVLDESHMTVPQIRGMYNGDRSRKQTLVDYGFRLPSALEMLGRYY